MPTDEVTVTDSTKSPAPVEPDDVTIAKAWDASMPTKGLFAHPWRELPRFAQAKLRAFAANVQAVAAASDTEPPPPGHEAGEAGADELPATEPGPLPEKWAAAPGAEQQPASVATRPDASSPADVVAAVAAQKAGAQ